MNFIQTTNVRICNFYNKHPTINFDTANIWLIDLLEKIDTWDTNPSSTSNSFIQKLHIIKTELINNIQETPITEKIIDIQLTELSEKMLSIISSIYPNTPLHIYSKITELLKSLFVNISHIIQVNPINNFYTTEFINKLDDNLNILFQNVVLLINSNETKMTEKFQNLIPVALPNPTSISNSNLQMYNETCHPGQPRPSSPMDHRVLSTILSKIYTSAEIISGPELNEDEIILKRLRKTNILIKNHELDTNILSDEIAECLITADEQRCNCIIISQYSGISTKKNYQIDIQNNHITVYVHNAEYNDSKIQTAVDIIDNLSSKLNQYKTRKEDDFIIPIDVMDNINEEYQLFISQKIAVVDVFKEHQKKVLSQIDELRFPSLDKLLSVKYQGPVAKTGIKCDLCKSYFANNRKALAAHKRGCARKYNRIT